MKAKSAASMSFSHLVLHWVESFFRTVFNAFHWMHPFEINCESLAQRVWITLLKLALSFNAHTLLADPSPELDFLLGLLFALIYDGYEAVVSREISSEVSNGQSNILK